MKHAINRKCSDLYEFAQRVSCVTNEYHVNQEIVPELVIKRLRAENSRLIEELKALKEAYTILERKFSGARDYGDDDYDDGKCVGLSLKPSPVAALSIEQKKEENEIEEDREEKEEEEKDKEGEEEDKRRTRGKRRDDVDINGNLPNSIKRRIKSVDPRADDSGASLILPTTQTSISTTTALSSSTKSSPSPRSYPLPLRTSSRFRNP